MTRIMPAISASRLQERNDRALFSLATPPGFEPRLRDSKSPVLPLHHGAIISAGLVTDALPHRYVVNLRIVIGAPTTTRTQFTDVRSRCITIYALGAEFGGSTGIRTPTDWVRASYAAVTSHSRRYCRYCLPTALRQAVLHSQDLVVVFTEGHGRGTDLHTWH